MRIGLSSRKHVPALFLDGNKTAFPLWKYRFVRAFEKSGMKLDEVGFNALSELQQGYYKPPFSLVGKTVLDIGACCGETAWYFIKVLGAKKVYCVECDKKRIDILNWNILVCNLNTEVYPQHFNLGHLALPVHFIKCDVEGAESLLLKYIDFGLKLVPCVLEAHGKQIRDEFLARGFRITKVFSTNECIMVNWSK